MKGSIFAAAALVGSAMADGNIHRRHEALHQRWASSSAVAPSSSAAETCGCTTKVITYYGSPTLVPVSSTATPSPEQTSTSTVSQTSTSTSTSTVTVPPSSVAPVSTSTSTPTPTPSSTSTPTPAAPLPTAGTTTFPSTGVYTVPATTLVVTDTTTVCGATTTEVPSGTHTYGGVTTVVDTDTVVTCPYATQSPSGSTVTDIVAYTTYTCPVAGTYTVVPGTTTFVPTSTMLVYPTPSAITPGTYTQPESTITVVRTDYTYVCPFATSTTSTSTPAPAPPATNAATTTAAAPATETENPTGVAAVSTSSTNAPAGASAGGLLSGLTNDVANVANNVANVASNVAGLASNVLSGLAPGQDLTGNGQYGMTFDPYTASGACMTQQEVTNNIGNIANKGFKAVRVYSTDCNTLQYVGSACKQFGLRMIPGVYVDQTGVSGAQSQINAIANWAQWGQVDLIVVGNEAINYGYVTASEMAGLISSAKSAFQSAGFTGPVTTSEPINIWQSYGVSDLCSNVDLVGANIHPFFNAATTASAAGAFVLSEYQILKNICGKDVLNLETGWPTQGQPNGVAVPGISQQQTAIRGIASTLGAKSVFFSYQNNQWTSPGAFGVEPFWGCVDLF